MYQIVFDQGNPFYIYVKHHTCPQCGKHISTSYRNEIISMKEAKLRRLVKDAPLFEDEYEIRHPIFWCTHCDHTITVTEMKEWEREQKERRCKERQEKRAKNRKRRY